MSKNTENQGFEIDEKSLDSLLSEVETELMPVLKAEAARLNKADDDKGPPKEDKGGDDKSAEGSAPPAGPDASASAPPAGPPAGPPAPPAGPPGADASASAPPMGSPPASPSPSPASPGLPADPAALAQMVAQMPLEQQKALYLASKQALAASMAAGAGSPAGAPPMGGAPAGAPPMAPPGPDASAAGAGAPPMAPPPPAPPAGAPPADASGAPPMDPTMKQEMKPSEGNGGQMKVAKSEKTVDNKNKENEELRALVKSQGDQIALLTKAVTHIAGTPIRKAVTSISALKKTEGDGSAPKQLTKAEMNATLTQMIKGGKLNKADKEKVRKFYDEGSTNFESIQHLFQ